MIDILQTRHFTTVKIVSGSIVNSAERYITGSKYTLKCHSESSLPRTNVRNLLGLFIFQGLRSLPLVEMTGL